MSRHHYPSAALMADYLRAGAGLAVLATPLLFAELAPVLFYICLILALIFLGFGLKTALRHLTVVELDENGIRTVGPMGHALAWSDSRELLLRYFSTRRDREGGWLQLVVKGPRRSLEVESTISDFDDLAQRARRFAEAAGVPLSEATRNNFQSLEQSNPGRPA